MLPYLRPSPFLIAKEPQILFRRSLSILADCLRIVFFFNRFGLHLFHISMLESKTFSFIALEDGFEVL